MDLPPQDAEAIVQTLNSQPSQANLTQALTSFEPYSSSPSQSSASVVFALVNTTVPGVWRLLQSTEDGKQIARLIVRCLSSVSGVNALLMRLNQIYNRIQHLDAVREKNDLEDVAEIIASILQDEQFSPATVVATYNPTDSKQKLLLSEYISIVGGSKLLNGAARALQEVKGSWIADGKLYSKWLGEKLSTAVIQHSNMPEVADLLGKALNIGYPDAVVEGLLPKVLNDLPNLAKTLLNLRRTSLLIFTKHLLKYLSSTYLTYTMKRDGARWWDGDKIRVGAVGNLLYQLYQQDKLSKILADVVKNRSGLDGLSIQRATVLAVSKISSTLLASLADETLTSFMDPLFINHAPIVAQENLLQLLLLLLGRTDLERLREIASSPVYHNGLSSRLSATVDRSRVLGMIVGEAVSRKIDTEGRQLKFKVPEMDEPSIESWKSLIDVDDHLYPLKDLKGGIVEETIEEEVIEASTNPPAEEVMEEMTEVEEDIKSYPIPDSDEEDSDEDPTLVSREKTPIPLYIRDLMKYLQADDYNKVHIGLKTASKLIRQKATFGTELTDQAEGLARILIGLQDTYEMEQFQEMRQEALIALVASAPDIVAPYLINVYFTADFSIQQRCIVLSALGIGARELAGLEKSEPSSQQLLPPGLHRQYVSPTDRVAQQLEIKMIEPIQEAAVSKLSGPQVLQVRRYPSRPANQQKPKINQLSKIAGREFIFPLIGRWWIQQHDYGGRGIHSQPILLSTLVRTVGIILQASAPSALDLRAMTKEYWDFLLALRSVSADPSVVESILFGMLVILEITEPRTAAEHFPKQVIETQAWAAGSNISSRNLTIDIFQGLDEGKAKLLASGILLKIKEIVSKHERLLLGDIISFGSISSAPMGLNLR